MLTFKYEAADEPLTLKLGQYSNGRIAIIAEGADTEEQWATISVNIPEAKLSDDEICIKNWSENEDIVKAVYSTGIFEDTGRVVPTGFVAAPIWRVVNKEVFNSLGKLS